MRIRFEFDLPGGRLVLPIDYNHYVQSMVYNHISRDLADFIHRQGFTFEKRHFSLFNFSRIFGKARIQKTSDRKGDTRIEFQSPIYFYLSAPYEQILQEFANCMVSGKEVLLGGKPIYIASVQVMMPPVFDDKTTSIKVLSPITVRSTFGDEQEGAGKQKTYYFSPLEARFSEQIRLNLLKKDHSFMNQYPQDQDLWIRPLHFSEQRNFHLVVYKGFIIKGYSGIFQLKASSQLKQFAYDTGLGERNAQGFGMFEPWNPDSSHHGNGY